MDFHFAGASHHLFRFREASSVSLDSAAFHLQRHKAHLRHMMQVIYRHGDFENAEDPSMMDMDLRESWNPDMNPIPDRSMFNSMLPDVRYQMGQNHPYDVLLRNLAPPVEISKGSASPRLRVAGSS